MSECAVALVGAGAMTREHARAFASLAGVRLAGIHSRTRTKAEAAAKELGIGMVAESIDELYARTRANLVVVSVPELATNAVAGACFRHPWTVLIEKPAGLDVADAEAIAAQAASAGRRAYVALNRRHYGATQAALARLQEDEAPRFIKIQDQQDQAAALEGGQPLKVVENWMYANSIHVIDYLRVFGRGEIVEVAPVVPWDAKRPSVVIAKIRFASGDLGIYEGVWNGPGPWAVTVSTPAQRLEMRPLEQVGIQRRGERRLTALDIDARDTAFKPGFRAQAEKAVAAALGRPSDLPSLQDGVETMRLVSRIFAPEPS